MVSKQYQHRGSGSHMETNEGPSSSFETRLNENIKDAMKNRRKIFETRSICQHVRSDVQSGREVRSPAHGLSLIHI